MRYWDRPGLFIGLRGLGSILQAKFEPTEKIHDGVVDNCQQRRQNGVENGHHHADQRADGEDDAESNLLRSADIEDDGEEEALAVAKGEKTVEDARQELDSNKPGDQDNDSDNKE